MKSLMKYSAYGAIAAGFAAVTAGTAFADPPHCPPGHEKKGWCDNHDSRWDRDRDHHRDRDRYDDRRDEARAYREGYREGQRDAIRHGDRYYSDYEVIRDYDRYGLNPPPNGYYYAEVDGDILMVQLATQVVAQLLN